MQRRKFHMIGTASLTSTSSSHVLSGCNLSKTTKKSTETSHKLISVPVITRHTFYITEGFIKQPDEKLVYFRGFSQNDTTLEVPAKPFVIRQDETVTIIINNTLTTEHSFVIDGIVDSGAIKPGESKTIVFTANKAGSYLFYDNLNAPFNRLSGLHGGMEVIAENNNQGHKKYPAYKQELFRVISDIDPLWHNEFKNNVTPSTPFTPSYFSINGLSIKVVGRPNFKESLIEFGFLKQTKTKQPIENKTLYAGINAQVLH